MAALPEIDVASPLQFVINAAASNSDAEEKREVIEVIEVIEVALRGLVDGKVTCCSAAPPS